MLTQELLLANEGLKTLTQDQINAIVTMSENDENAVIGSRIGEIYRQMDETIAQHLGIARNGDEKTYLYLERASKEFSQEKQGLLDKVAKLEKSLADGASEELKNQLAQAKKDVTAITTQFNTLKAEYDTAKADHEKALFGVKIDNELSLAMGNIKFKDGLPQAVTNVIVEQVKAKIKGYNPQYIDNGQGGKVLAFTDANGAIMRNTENQLNPFTASELLTKELKTMGVLDDKAQGGIGSRPTTPQHTMDISGAKTRIEANDIIAKNLTAQGHVFGTREYQEAMTKAWQDNNVMSLPEK